MPAHEIEVLVEKSVRNELEKLCAKNDRSVSEHIIKHHEDIPTYDLIRKCIAKVTINLDQITLKIRAKNFNKLVKKHLNLSITEHDEKFEIITPYKTGKAQRGAIVIEAKNQSDIFNLPSANLKRFIQGIIWRDEHFSGDTLTEIAQREGYSDAYVGKCIMTSFDVLMSA